MSELERLQAENARLAKERDEWKQRIKWTIDEVHKIDGELMVCEGNECGGCENDDSLPCEELCRGLAHQLETKEANRGYDKIVTLERQLSESVAAQAAMVERLRGIKSLCPSFPDNYSFGYYKGIETALELAESPAARELLDRLEKAEAALAAKESQ